MKIIIFGDESGTHDGSDFSLLAGWIAYESVWNEFIPAWQMVLAKYKVESFHFSEFAEASNIKRNPKRKFKPLYETNQFKHLSLVELDSFYLECSTLLTSSKLEFEIAILDRKKFVTDKANPTKIYPPEVYDKNPEGYLIDEFIKRCTSRILTVWGTAYESVTFVFDKRSNAEWEQMIKDEIAGYAKWKWPMNPVEFKNKIEATPIQAADMLAYRGNQICRNVVKGLTLTNPSVLDSIIAKRMRGG
jgi:Protein of unknown function (DUF3800)